MFSAKFEPNWQKKLALELAMFSKITEPEKEVQHYTGYRLGSHITSGRDI